MRRKLALVGINDERDIDEAIDALVDAIMAAQKAMPAKPYQPGPAPGMGLQLVASKKNPMVRRWQGQPKPPPEQRQARPQEQPQQRQGKINVGVAMQRPQQQPQEPPQVQTGRESWDVPDEIVQKELQQARMLADEIVDKSGLNEEFARLRDQLGASKQTKETHTDDTGAYSGERQRLHNRIIEGMLHGKPSQPEPMVVFMGGLPGSGKSTIVKQYGFQDFVHIDSDEVKRRLPEYKGWNAALCQDEATDVVTEVVGKAEENRQNILIDCTLKTGQQYIEQMQAFRALGYKVGLIFADLPPEKAMQRAIERYANPKGDHRFVDPRYIATHDHKNRKSYEQLKQYAQFYAAYNNDVPKGADPVVLEQKGV